MNSLDIRDADDGLVAVRMHAKTIAPATSKAPPIAPISRATRNRRLLLFCGKLLTL